MAHKKHRGLPVHNMADELPLSYADIAVDLPDLRDGMVPLAVRTLADEVEKEYQEFEITERDEREAQAVADLAQEAIELTGRGQDEIVDALEEIKEMAATTLAAQKACPTCHRPFLQATYDKEGAETKSSRIRRMAGDGMDKGDIARELCISYQFVHNVLSRPARTA
jgi:hypothetical protein